MSRDWNRSVINGKVYISPEEQQQQIYLEHIKCLKQMLYGPRTLSGLHCNQTWDGISCWPDTEANSTAKLPCANYIHNFYVDNVATRRCMPDGQWYFHPELNTTWSDYSSCFDVQPSAHTPKVSSVLENATGKIRLMYNIGYGASLLSLSVAVFIMVYFKRLHCPRNTVHLNLFIAFMLRAILSFLKENLLVQGLGLPSDVEKTPYGAVIFIDKGPHWECKTLFVCFYYVLSCSYMWIFVEGLHLHTLMMVSVFSERSSVKWYIAIGWGTPMSFIVPWIFVRAFVENELCWNTNPTSGYFWILKGPVVLTIAINFVFFINILRALMTKIMINRSRSSKTNKYKRFAKATLVLIPLFGVQYVIFLGFPDDLDPEVEVVKLYFEMFFNSFQGLLVAILFCFLNGEVQSEIMKLICNRGPYYRYRRYYRASFMGNSPCACQRNSGSQKLSPSSNRRHSMDTSSCLLVDSKARFVKTCYCQWHVDSKGHLCRHFIKRSANRNCASERNLRRAESCL